MNAIKPELSKEEMIDIMGALSSGFCCPKCANLSRRKVWSGWKCASTQCDFEASAPVPKLSLDQLALFKASKAESFTENQFCVGTTESGDYFMHAFDLAEACAVYCFSLKPNEVNSASIRANKVCVNILESANRGELELERRSTNMGFTSDPITSHFASNFDEHYFYGVNGMRDIPLREAPSEIREAIGQTAPGGGSSRLWPQAPM